MSLEVNDLAIAETDIAIVGMAAHLPGADTVATFWDNLKNGIESIRHYSKEELLAAGEAAHRLNRPDYVPAAAPLSKARCPSRAASSGRMRPTSARRRLLSQASNSPPPRQRTSVASCRKSAICGRAR